jgi:hypothetical protein
MGAAFAQFFGKEKPIENLLMQRVSVPSGSGLPQSFNPYKLLINREPSKTAPGLLGSIVQFGLEELGGSVDAPPSGLK